MADKSLLVVAAHPDDEVLGCGATVRLLVDDGWQAHLVLMTHGIGGRHDSGEDTPEIIEAKTQLAGQTDAAAAELGFATVTRFDFPDNRMDTISRMDLSHSIRAVVEKERPYLVLTHHHGDYNWDHGQTFEAVMMACRRDPTEFSPHEIRTFEVPSSTERGAKLPDRVFCPTIYTDVAATIAVKKRALQCYAGEYRPYPHARSVEGLEYLARQRGIEAGLEYAEAFQLIRKIED
ncbi:MAG: PIG-L family deacetylase [Rhodospirillales bacterium]|nr:PIG-L family deacetylase [Rhodospirillales bacterium]